MKKLIVILVLCFLNKSNDVYSQQILLSENFESGVLNPLITSNSNGTYNSNPGIQNNTNFGSTMAYGFGRSTCPANCFSTYTDTLTITFPTSTFVDSMKWSEMELLNNWGSQGTIYLDGILLTSSVMGAQPVNNHIPDNVPRYQAYLVGQCVTTIKFIVVDITNQSEITIDDLIITTSNLPTITAGSATTFCQGDSVTLTASAGSSYIWSNGESTQAINVETAGSYSVTVYYGIECFTTSLAEAVTVNPNPATPTITASDTTTFCQGGSVTLIAPTSTSYLWSTGASTQFINVDSSGNYSITVYNSFGCSAPSLTTTVTVNPTYISSDSASICEGDTYTFPDGTTATTSTIYTSHLSTINACDSSVVTTLTVEVCAGINEYTNDNSFLLYPNPTSGKFTILLSSETEEIIVTNVLGQQVIKKQTKQKIANLQLENNGVYIVYLKTKQGTITQKLIVNR